MIKKEMKEEREGKSVKKTKKTERETKKKKKEEMKEEHEEPWKVMAWRSSFASLSRSFITFLLLLDLISM